MKENNIIEVAKVARSIKKKKKCENCGWIGMLVNSFMSSQIYTRINYYLIYHYKMYTVVSYLLRIISYVNEKRVNAVNLKEY